MPTILSPPACVVPLGLGRPETTMYASPIVSTFECWWCDLHQCVSCRLCGFNSSVHALVAWCTLMWRVKWFDGKQCGEKI